jgi:tRNA (cytosine34-C5)-methyltransferase
MGKKHPRSKATVQAAKKRKLAEAAAQDAEGNGNVDGVRQQQESDSWWGKLQRGEPTPFETYYWDIFDGYLPHDEWQPMLRALRTALPVTFRMSRMPDKQDAVKEALADSPLQAHGDKIYDHRGRWVSPPKALKWCGGWQLGCDKATLKFAHDPLLKELQRWIVKNNSLGVLTRQAVDSMVPPSLLEVESHHTVLDMCASPGSKTTQLLEALSQDADPEGIVVANDFSPQRAYMLVRRCAALGVATKNLLVTNHKGQQFPNVSVGAGAELLCDGRYPRGIFDRIVADVPCSGDGTLRKNAQIWTEWNCEFAMQLHPLQLLIALRAAALLKVGGYMVYSTCSFNPIENESVVAELIKRCGGALEIVDASARLKALKRYDGMSDWRVGVVREHQVVQFESYEQIQQVLRVLWVCCLLLSSACPSSHKRSLLPAPTPPCRAKV